VVEIDEIAEVYFIGGNCDMLAKAYAERYEDFAFVVPHWVLHPSLGETSTLMTSNALKPRRARNELAMEQEDMFMRWLRWAHAWMGMLIVIGLLVACAGTPEQRSTGEVIDDAAITTKVKTGLLGDPIVSAFAITVETSRGVVNLTGIVNSTGERARAIQIAQEVGGVRRVDARNLFVKQ
jgi:hyperosmotically inducible protein